MNGRIVPTTVAALAILAGLARADEADKLAREILADRCLSCHSADAKKGGLDLSRRPSALAGGDSGPAVVPGKPAESLIIEKLTAGEMPPKGALAPEQVAAVRDWVARGAEYGPEPIAARRAGADWWSLRPIRRPDPPAVGDRGWARSEIDLFILARLEASGLKPSPEATRREFIRRVTFDLIGLPPTPEEVSGFVNDPAEDAHAALVDHLLASPRYGERWARHWLDVVRFAESHGYETNSLRPNAWPYRDYVIRAFNDDVPFSRFVAEQIAGDALPDGDFLARSATGFLVGGTHDTVGNQTEAGSKQQRVDDLDDIITATGTTFLGLTVHCARCHDHKFDPIAQKDYYGLQAVFAGVQHADRDLRRDDADRDRREAESISAEIARIDRELDAIEPLARVGPGPASRPAVNPRRNVERFPPIVAKAVRMTVRATADGIEPCVDELEAWTAREDSRNVAPSGVPSASSTYANNPSHKLEHINDARYGNGRSWISAESGRGWVRIDLPEAVAIDRVVWGRDREEAYRDRTARDYSIEVADESGRWTEVASSIDRSAAGPGTSPADPARAALEGKKRELRERMGTLSPTMKVYAGTFAQPGPTRLLRRGDPMQPKDAVPPSALRSVRPPLVLAEDAPESERRLALARWIASPENPLPARVMVNRLWQGHFGRGIVATPSDFGFNGDRPSHPELLDWLAAEFLANGGRLKPLHRRIVLSAAYRQSSRIDPKGMAVDASDRLLWRVAPRRLEAEAIRDAILSVSGELDLRPGGPGYNIWEPNTNYVVVFTPRRDLGPDTFRRMIYQFKPRSQQDVTFGAFDCPDGGLVAPRRNVSTTALQAANLLNSRFLLARSESFARRLEREAEGPDRVGRAFLLAVGREPTDAELRAAEALVRDHGLSTLCRALINANEFVYLP